MSHNNRIAVDPETLKKSIHSTGLTIKEFSAKAEICYDSLLRICRGEINNPKKWVVDSINNALNVHNPETKGGGRISLREILGEELYKNRHTCRTSITSLDSVSGNTGEFLLKTA